MGQIEVIRGIVWPCAALCWLVGMPGWAANGVAFRPSSHPNVFVRDAPLLSPVGVRTYSVPGFPVPVLLTAVPGTPKPAVPPASPNSVMLDSRLDLALSGSINARGELTLSCTRQDAAIAPETHSEDSKP